jgi:hypothetical protein
MTKLRRDGVISVVDNRKVTVPDLDRLLAVAAAG